MIRRLLAAVVTAFVVVASSADVPSVAAQPTAAQTMSTAPADARTQRLARLPSDSRGSDEKKTSHRLQQLASSPPLLRTFFATMPKGGDLHNHASGAVYAESMVDWATADDDCLDLATLVTAQRSYGACPLGFTSLPTALENKTTNRTALIDAWSMNGFVPHEGETGHDHFFNTFGKFGATLATHNAGVVAEATRHAAEDHVAYLELMVTFGGAKLAAVAAKTPVTNDLAATRRAMDAAGFSAAVDEAAADVAVMEKARRAELGCTATPQPPPCAVEVRYLQQAIRTAPPAVTYAQLALGFALAKRQPLVVGVNLVAPEDDPVALRDYTLHMRMIQTLHAIDPNVNVSLHAGELTLGLVPRAYLADHIREAIEIAGAKRIGHGVDVTYENDAIGLLHEMHEKHVMVEIAQTSNDGILGVRGVDHPLPTYLAYGVPTALATDDEGVSRNDFTNEFVRAVTTFHLTYAQIKTMVRNSVHYGFLPGASLWIDADFHTSIAACPHAAIVSTPRGACAAFLEANPHAAMEARLERELAAFEHAQAQLAFGPAGT
jgi:hypothetical protein